MRNTPVPSITYWLLQLVGWGSMLSANLILSGRMETSGRSVYFRNLLYLILGISISHLMRIAIRRSRLIEGNNIRFLIGVFSMTFAFVVLHASVEFAFIMLTGLRVDSDKILDPLTLFLRQAYFASFVFFGWSAIYSVVLLLRKSHALQLDRMHQIQVQRELELKSIKSSINPHFIFNALNSIRALIDDHPVRAREAVTSLGNILHRSLEAGEHDTVPLRKELDIVRDYLSLQHIRFEDRLTVEYDLDPVTLNLPISTMMLQTLVENAVKHGVSREVKGGIIRIASKRKDDRFEVSVQNTGRLNPILTHSGFGWSSTTDRLAILYGEGAVFTLKELPNRLVEALVDLPVSIAERSTHPEGEGYRRSLVGRAKQTLGQR